jgi:phosphoserine phosphatase
MESIIIVMSPDNVKITSHIISCIMQFLQKKQIIVHKQHEVFSYHCWHFYCHFKGDLKHLQSELCALFFTDKIDIAVLPADNRLKKILISDMDSTMINQECIDELADFIGKKHEISLITERAMQGELNFEESLTHRVALLKGLKKQHLHQCYQEKITLMAGAKELLKFHNQNNSQTILVSGGFTFFAEKIAKTLNFHHFHANILNFDTHDILTGTVQSPILGRKAKAEILQSYVKKSNITLSDCLAVGDGANDLDMIEIAGLGIAYHAKPAVAQAARVAINFCDLKALIYLQSSCEPQ